MSKSHHSYESSLYLLTYNDDGDANLIMIGTMIDVDDDDDENTDNSDVNIDVDCDCYDKVDDEKFDDDCDND